MKENIEYSKFDTKECIEQALYHCNQIGNIFDGSREQYFFSAGHMANVMHVMWFEHENVKRQLEILKGKFK